MKHHLDIALASDASQQVLELRRLRGELGTQTLDSANRRLYPLPSQLVQREAFAATTDGITDSFQGEPKLIRWGRHGS